MNTKTAIRLAVDVPPLNEDDDVEIQAEIGEIVPVTELDVTEEAKEVTYALLALVRRTGAGEAGHGADLRAAGQEAGGQVGKRGQESAPSKGASRGHNNGIDVDW